MRKNTPDDFWKKVDRNGPVPECCPERGPCWIWTAGLENGYGRHHVSGKHYLSHRLSWMLTIGPIPADRPHVLHHCDTPPCVNPTHLWLGTHADNMADMARKGRAKCLRGNDHWSRHKVESRPRGESHGMAVLRESDIREIRRRHGDGERLGAIARVFGVNNTTISRICRRVNWKHVT